MAPIPPSLPPAPFKTPFDEQPGTNLSLPEWFRTWLAGQRPSRAWLQWFNKLVALPEPFTTYTPVITAGSGTFTTVSATGRYRRIGKLIFIQITITITTNGTAAGSVIATLPFTALNLSGVTHVLAGRALAPSGKMLQGQINSGVNFVNIENYDNTYPGADGQTLVVSGFYEIN
jgi:hypothetical protein